MGKRPRQGTIELNGMTSLKWLNMRWRKTQTGNTLKINAKNPNPKPHLLLPNRYRDRWAFRHSRLVAQETPGVATPVIARGNCSNFMCPTSLNLPSRRRRFDAEP